VRMDRLLEEVEVVSTRGLLEVAEVTSVEFDSKDVHPGALFCCLRGAHSDGHEFAAAAVDAGAVGLIVEHFLDLEVPQAQVLPGADRRSMARIAAALYGHPAESLRTIGVTGTNGKTTVTHMLAAIFRAWGTPATVVGTLGGARTTPEAPVLQRLLARARESGRRVVALEVSSHALTQDRVEGIRFAAAVFTNLGHDHLDHHGTMEDYFEAKASLFVPERSSLGVVRADDPWGARLLERAEIEMVPYSLSDADGIECRADETRFVWRGREIGMPLAGAFQVPNALAAATTATALGVTEDAVVEGLSGLGQVQGRFEVLEAGAPFTVVVDYAHTPEGLEVALDSARRIASSNRVLIVFGAGGDRDHEKRPAMGASAARGADVVVLTSDNPRSEDPMSIIEAVSAGIVPTVELVTEPDRARAIDLAVRRALPGDVVLIAGKGHETDIEIAGRRIPFDDKVAAREAVRRSRGERKSTESAS
jgi:UDP-N-acetylmuramoyl-L-alanyl-D-glutamate--2,6-diaminopimelate ligase